MTLFEIWESRPDMSRVAARKGSVQYVSLAVKSLDDLELNTEDRQADDWGVFVLSRHECGSLGHATCEFDGMSELTDG